MTIASIARLSVLATALMAGSLLSGAAGAHQIWLEQNDKAASIYFGEFGDNLREASPGLLDKFTLKNVTWISAGNKKPLQASKTASAFVLNGKVAPGETIIVEETGYPGWESKKDGKVLFSIWTPAARIVADHSAQAPALTLDLLPTGTPGQFKVTYQGRSVIVTINDRGGFGGAVCLDLTYGAFLQIANPDLGVIPVQYEILY